MTENDLRKNAYYKNIKNGQKYKLMGVARHSEDPDSQYTMYHQMYGEFSFWIRPLHLFLAKFEPWTDDKEDILWNQSEEIEHA